jgi:endogenous inhibitor of DNA gyrase (YacG/DUF329 family)
LKKANSSLPVNDVAKYKFQSKKYSNKDLDMWAAIKYVIDGEYDLVPDKHKDMLVKCMQSYLDHISVRQ